MTEKEREALCAMQCDMEKIWALTHELYEEYAAAREMILTDDSARRRYLGDYAHRQQFVFMLSDYAHTVREALHVLTKDSA